MVLICNNNVLTIEKFHENRCREKNEIKQIICDRKYLKEKYKETPEKEKEPICTSTYIKILETYMEENPKPSSYSITLSANTTRRK